ncbi:MAG: B12-binding domain-containing radical SAM protein [Salibacteraceae bacterium]
MNRKKIILYNPKAVFYDMPLALLALASNLDLERFEPIIVDARIDPDPKQTIEKHLADAIAFGATVLTGKPIQDALEITQWVKNKKPALKTIWGGWHASLFPKKTLENEALIDISVQGQGEKTFQEILEYCIGEKEIKDIKGLCFRDGDEVKQNPPRALTDMNELNQIDYDFINVEDYFEKKGQRQFDYISSTGCHFRCAFCADPFVFGRNYSAVEPNRMGKEFDFYFKKYKFTEINFQDETLFTYPKRIRALANELIDRNIKVTWAGTMRADQAHRMNDEDFALIKKSGLRRVLIGVESGSQEMMDWLKKDIKLEYVFEAAEKCKKHDIGVIFPFIVGFPKETQKSLDATISVVKQLNAISPKFETPIFYFKPYPGSRITDDVVKEGYILPDSLEEWSKFDYIGSAGPWVSDEMYSFFENFKFYLKVGYGRRRPLFYPVQKLARWRVDNDQYGLPLERKMFELARPAQKLS